MEELELRPIDLAHPNTQDVLQAMRVLKNAEIPQTTDNIRIALEELHSLWKEYAQWTSRSIGKSWSR